MHIRQYRLAIASGLVGFLACISLVGVVYWLFGERAHNRVISPDDRWTAVVTKRMGVFGSVDVHLRMEGEGWHPIGSLEVYIDQRDMWSDIKPGSYEIKWPSSTEFLVGDKEPGSPPRWRGRLVGQYWSVDAAP